MGRLVNAHDAIVNSCTLVGSVSFAASKMDLVLDKKGVLSVVGAEEFNVNLFDPKHDAVIAHDLRELVRHAMCRRVVLRRPREFGDLLHGIDTESTLQCWKLGGEGQAYVRRLHTGAVAFRERVYCHGAGAVSPLCMCGQIETMIHLTRWCPLRSHDAAEALELQYAPVPDAFWNTAMVPLPWGQQHKGAVFSKAIRATVWEIVKNMKARDIELAKHETNDEGKRVYPPPPRCCRHSVKSKPTPFEVYAHSVASQFGKKVDAKLDCRAVELAMRTAPQHLSMDAKTGAISCRFCCTTRSSKSMVLSRSTGIVVKVNLPINVWALKPD